MIVNAFLPWLGGKRRLAAVIAGHLERLPHGRYVEPFADAGHVFFRKSPAAGEALADANAELVVLYRVVQRHLEEFLRHFRWALVSREEFGRCRQARPETLTDVQRAVRFYYLQKLSFAGRNWSRAFRTKTDGPPQFNLLRLEEELSAVHLRLARVQVENLPWAVCIRRYDREHTFFYLDRPYHGVEGYYGKGLFERTEFEELAETLAGLKGRFLLSLNDVPEVREIFKAFRIRTVSQRYPSGSHSPNHVDRVTELLISDRPFDAAQERPLA